MSLIDDILDLLIGKDLNCEDCGKLCHKCECEDGPRFYGEERP